LKTRILGAAVSIVALSGLLTAGPAQADDGVASARVESGGHAGAVHTTVDFTSATRVVFKDFTVRDICPGDNLPVRARAVYIFTDGSTGFSNWRVDSNGCGNDGTNFGDLVRSGTKSVARVTVMVCILRTNGTTLACNGPAYRENPYS
jgi:hypothetical protein